MKKLKSIIVLCLLASFAFGQTADINGGCIPLEVNFTGPNLPVYYWEFGDNASSDLQNPTHVFTTAGTYDVTLYQGVNGTKIGEVEIKVYPDPIITINSDNTEGCGPLTVVFTPSVDIDSDVTIQSYLWTFGDGNSSTLQSPTHTYQSVGDFTVSLAVKTSLVECDKTEIFDDYISVFGVESSFVLNKIADCDVPATFTISNLSEDNPNYEYFWDFDNGTDFMGYSPGSVTYNAPGTYTISLTVIDENGCESLRTRNVLVGPPFFNIDPTDICIGLETLMPNNTIATSYSWNLGANASPMTSNDKNPAVVYSAGGQKTITLSITNQFNCSNDTTFVITVQDPSAAFTIDPPIADCTEPVSINISALEGNWANYDWNINGTNVSNFSFNYEWPERDSLHLHWIDSLKVELKVTTDIGCEAESIGYFTQRRPDAYFLVDKSRGCAPLNVNFTDQSRSLEDIVSWEFIYGDGTTDVVADPSSVNHTFQQPGEYYVRLVIENDKGCIDTSAGLWILVGEQIESDYVLDNTSICLGDTIRGEMTNLDDRIDAWQMTSDAGRFNQCWTSPETAHTFINSPGVYPLTITTEYNGCYWQETIPNAITVNGAKANIGWMTNCEDPYSVMFQSKSIGETLLEWELPIDTLYSEETFTHSFADKGQKTIYLTATDEGSTCPSSVDSAIIHIVDIEASFSIPEFVCNNLTYDVNAALSTDVINTCDKGYLWNLPSNRPRELGTPDIEISFPDTGYQEVTLIVEDINGCTDTLTQSTTSFSLDADFTSDQTLFCLPATISFLDQSIADTSIVSWDWSFNSSDQNPTEIFLPETTDSIFTVTLTIEDAIGCVDEQNLTLVTYDVTSSISFDNGPGICVGESITFNATDFTDQGSFLNYEWDFDIFGTSNNSSETIEFDQSGMFDMSIVFTEDQSGCQGEETIAITVVDVPIADFSTTVDDQEEICHPAIIEFMNTSVTDGIVNHFWNFGGGIGSNEINPVNSFPKGTHEVELIVRSIYGCSDTINKSYTLVGPEGDMALDKNSICKGDEITFTMNNPIDVTDFTWVFGDGTTTENINPVTHQFDFNPPNGETKVDLILKSAENGCEFILTEPIFISEVLADFEYQDSSYCEGLATFNNLSVGDVSVFAWDFGNGETSNENNPSVQYDELGNYTVTLRVSDQLGICSDERSVEIELEDVPDFIFFPNVFTPNSDGMNDYFNVAVLPAYSDFVKVRTFQVYNRWGELLYDNDAPDLGWDGNKKSAVAPATVYAYYIEVEIVDCGTKSKKGNVTIIR